MLRSLSTASTGMNAQQQNIDVISNNIANVNTTGFKKGRAEFKDLMYQSLNYSVGANETDKKQVGLGTKLTAIYNNFDQGSFKETGNSLDLSIAGKGFFKVTDGSGEPVYTRDGSFKIDKEGKILTSNGFYLDAGGIQVPPTSTGIVVRSNGNVQAQMADGTNTILGNIKIHMFPNQSGLKFLGNNVYQETVGSGNPSEVDPGFSGSGTIESGFLETSNVQLVVEMTNLITAQRAYEANSKIIQSSDELLKTVNQLKR
jgi:flagellar basal-body rod protein FlgG